MNEWNGEMNEFTLPFRHKIQHLSRGSLRLLKLPLGHVRTPQNLTRNKYFLQGTSLWPRRDRHAALTTKLDPSSPEEKKKHLQYFVSSSALRFGMTDK